MLFSPGVSLSKLIFVDPNEKVDVAKKAEKRKYVSFWTFGSLSGRFWGIGDLADLSIFGHFCVFLGAEVDLLG